MLLTYCFTLALSASSSLAAPRPLAQHEQGLNRRSTGRAPTSTSVQPSHVSQGQNGSHVSVHPSTQSKISQTKAALPVSKTGGLSTAKALAASGSTSKAATSKMSTTTVAKASTSRAATSKASTTTVARTSTSRAATSPLSAHAATTSTHSSSTASLVFQSSSGHCVPATTPSMSTHRSSAPSSRAVTSHTSSKAATSPTSSKAVTSHISSKAATSHSSSRTGAANKGTATSTAAAGTSTITPGDEQSWLTLHNTFRAEYGASKVVWNDTLANYAQSAADRCIFSHTHGPYGENLAAGSGGGYDLTSGFDSWAGEASSYDYSTQSGAASHFTAVVWKSTTAIGCAAATCGADTVFPGWTSPTLNLVCEYWPAGNIVGENGIFYIDNVGRYGS